MDKRDHEENEAGGTKRVSSHVPRAPSSPATAQTTTLQFPRAVLGLLGPGVCAASTRRMVEPTRGPQVKTSCFLNQTGAEASTEKPIKLSAHEGAAEAPPRPEKRGS